MKQGKDPRTIGKLAQSIKAELLEKYPTCIHCGKPCVHVCPGCEGPIHLECIFPHEKKCGGPQ